MASTLKLLSPFNTVFVPAALKTSKYTRMRKSAPVTYFSRIDMGPLHLGKLNGAAIRRDFEHTEDDNQ